MASLLIVEDDLVVGFDLQRQLEAAGHVVVGVVSSVEEARTVLKARRPELVIMDIHLEGREDGLRAAEELYVCDNIPVVLLTAYADDATVARAAPTGAYAYLVKPFDVLELSSSIVLALHKHEELLALRRRAAFFQSALDEMPTAVVLATLDGDPIFLNRAARVLVDRGDVDPRALKTFLADQPAQPDTANAQGTAVPASRRSTASLQARVRPVGTDRIAIYLSETVN